MTDVPDNGAPGVPGAPAPGSPRVAPSTSESNVPRVDVGRPPGVFSGLRNREGRDLYVPDKDDGSILG